MMHAEPVMNVITALLWPPCIYGLYFSAAWCWISAETLVWVRLALNFSCVNGYVGSLLYRLVLLCRSAITSRTRCHTNAWGWTWKDGDEPDNGKVEMQERGRNDPEASFSCRCSRNCLCLFCRWLTRPEHTLIFFFFAIQRLAAVIIIFSSLPALFPRRTWCILT